MTDDEHFLHVLDELRGYYATKTDYTLVRAGGLLRALFLDGANSVADRANKSRRLPLRFRTMNFRVPLPISMGRVRVHWGGVSPEGCPDAPTIECTRDEFLGAPLVWFDGVQLTVRDVVKVAADMKGGVHRGIPMSIEDEAAVNLDAYWRTNGTEASSGALRGVCFVVLEALAPLERAIRTASPQAGPGAVPDSK
jgi:hypothetical protein